MYRIYFTQRSLKDLKNIDINIQKRIAVKLKEWADNPILFARKLINPKLGTYRFRIGGLQSYI